MVFKTPIGFGDGNSHKGDIINPNPDNDLIERKYEPFPGEILVSGTIMKNVNGKIGKGTQLVALIPKGKVFRVGYSCWKHGIDKEYYYVWDGSSILRSTISERMVGVYWGHGKC